MRRKDDGDLRLTVCDPENSNEVVHVMPKSRLTKSLGRKNTSGHSRFSSIKPTNRLAGQRSDSAGLPNLLMHLGPISSKSRVHKE